MWTRKTGTVTVKLLNHGADELQWVFISIRLLFIFICVFNCVSCLRTYFRNVRQSHSVSDQTDYDEINKGNENYEGSTTLCSYVQRSSLINWALALRSLLKMVPNDRDTTRNDLKRG